MRVKTIKVSPEATLHKIPLTEEIREAMFYMVCLNVRKYWVDWKTKEFIILESSTRGN